jgi:hypothetical protein
MRYTISFLPTCLVALALIVLPTNVRAISCGPHMSTYAVHGPDGSTASGLRCVRVTWRSDDGSSADFTWYGEGNWGGGPYRHLGTGYINRGEFGSFARAADMFGNGEAFNSFASNLIPQVTAGSWPAPQEIRIGGDWNEIWRLAIDVAYAPLPLPANCGPRFRRYIVSDQASTRQGTGVRCVVDLGLPNGNLWFGTGEWDGGQYSHIGQFTLPSGSGAGVGQATDLCNPHFGGACNDFPAASLTFTSRDGGYQVSGAWSEFWTVPTISIFSLNPGDLTGRGFGDISWRVRSTRVAAWMAENSVVPDIISLQQIAGWRWCLFSTNNWDDYDAADRFLTDLRDVTGVTYRVAYLTGIPGQHTALPTCKNYSGHALLYNPARLINLTAQQTANVAHDAENIKGPHLRRSLPLCNRGTRLMPLEALIDGPPQTDKCDLETPSGPSWVIIPEGHHIVASFNRFAPVWDRSRTVDVFNVNPVAGREQLDARLINFLVDYLEPPPYGGTSLYFPPLMIGDFNASGENDFPGFKTVFGDRDVNLLLMGKEEFFPSQCGNWGADLPVNPGHPASSRSLVIPSDVIGEACRDGGPPNVRVSDHCGIFVQFELDSKACGFRRVFIDGPRFVDAHASYRLSAVPAGGGRDWAYRWEPGGVEKSQLDATAGDTNTSQTWTVEVTERRTGVKIAGSKTVTVSPQPPLCVSGRTCSGNTQCCELGEPAVERCCLRCVPMGTSCP